MSKPAPPFGVLICDSDGHLAATNLAWIVEMGRQHDSHIDIIANAGGVQDLVHRPGSSYVMESLRSSIGNGGVYEIYLQAHGPAFDVSNERYHVEKTRQAHLLRRAAEIIRQAFPELKGRLHIHGQWVERTATNTWEIQDLGLL